MFPSKFFENIKNKIVPDIMETIYKLRTELEVNIDKLSKTVDKHEEQIKMLAGDSHPQQDFHDRIIKLEEFEKQVRRKKAFKRKDVK